MSIIDYDEAMEVVFKWITTKKDYKFSAEYCYLLFYLLIGDSMSISGVLTFADFITLYKTLNLDYYQEATKLIPKVYIP